MMSMNVQRPKRQLLVLSVSVCFFHGMIYYVLGNPQCSKGWIAIINSWLYDGLSDDNDINYKAQYWPSLVQSYDEMIKKVEADDPKFDLWSTDGFNQRQPRNVGAIVMFTVLYGILCD